MRHSVPRSSAPTDRTIAGSNRRTTVPRLLSQLPHPFVVGSQFSRAARRRAAGAGAGASHSEGRRLAPRLYPRGLTPQAGNDSFLRGTRQTTTLCAHGEKPAEFLLFSSVFTSLSVAISRSACQRSGRSPDRTDLSGGTSGQTGGTLCRPWKTNGIHAFPRHFYLILPRGAPLHPSSFQSLIRPDGLFGRDGRPTATARRFNMDAG